MVIEALAKTICMVPIPESLIHDHDLYSSHLKAYLRFAARYEPGEWVEKSLAELERILDIGGAGRSIKILAKKGHLEIWKPRNRKLGGCYINRYRIPPARLSDKEKKSENITKPKTLYYDWISTERERRGLTQGALAEKCNLSRKSIMRLESGTKRPAPTTLSRIVKVFDEVKPLFPDNVSIEQEEE